MRIGKFLLAAAAASMTVAPAMAANPAAGLSVSSSVRAGSVTANDSKLRGRGGGFIIAILAAAAVIVGIIIIVDSDDDPDSP